MSDTTPEQDLWSRTSHCPSCGKFIWYTHQYVDGRRVDGLRFGPLKDPAAMSECPKCKFRWFVYERRLTVDIVEGERTSEVVAEQVMKLDNSAGSSPLRRTKEIKEEWSRHLEVDRETSTKEQEGLVIGQKDVVAFSLLAENALKVNYRTVEETRRTYTETFAFEVPAGVVRTVTFTFRQIWQHGTVRGHGPDGTVVECPYRVVDSIELDVKQVDETRG